MHSSDFLWMFFSFAITNSSYLLAVSGTKPDVGPLQAFGCLDTQWCSVRGRAKSSESQMRFHQVSEMCRQPAGFWLNVNININRSNSSSEITEMLTQCQSISWRTFSTSVRLCSRCAGTPLLLSVCDLHKNARRTWNGIKAFSNRRRTTTPLPAMEFLSIFHFKNRIENNVLFT